MILALRNVQTNFSFSMPFCFQVRTLYRTERYTGGQTARCGLLGQACSPALHPNSSAGNVIGTGTSALRWPSYALAILHCWQAISTGSGAGTPLPVHTAMALMRRQSTWCSSVLPAHDQARRDIWLGGVFNTDPAPRPGMREREDRRTMSSE